MFDHLVFWHWWIVAGVLLIIEMLIPAFFFLWIAIAAVVTGVVVLLFPGMGNAVQLIVFAALCVASIIAWWRMRIMRPDQPNTSLLNRRGHQYVGRTFTLEEPITNGIGKIKVDDSTWKIQGLDLPAGSQIKVTDVDGVVLIIEPLAQ